MKTNSIEDILKIFKSNYQEIPLEKYKDPFKILVSTLLSARTKDETTAMVCDTKLFKKVKSFKDLSNLKITEIEKLIYPVGFYKNKARFLQALSVIVVNNNKGLVPNSFEELTTLPGVGRKTANLVLCRAFNLPAIAVDTHVHRISNLLGLVKTNMPIETEVALKEIVSKKHWSSINKYFVSIGQQYRNTKKLINFLLENNLTIH